MSNNGSGVASSRDLGRTFLAISTRNEPMKPTRLDPKFAEVTKSGKSTRNESPNPDPPLDSDPPLDPDLILESDHQLIQYQISMIQAN